MKKTILILAANPANKNRLRLEEEVREIESGLEIATKGNEFILKPKWATRHTDVRRAMLKFKPNIVHFCGHGLGEEGIVLEDNIGQANPINAETLSNFFRLFSDSVECVVLNACYSVIQAEAIAQHINYVVGMKKDIGDRNAIEFAVAFYDALGAGEPIEFAYELARNSIQWIHLSEHLIPKLYVKDDRLTTQRKIESSNLENEPSNLDNEKFNQLTIIENQVDKAMQEIKELMSVFIPNFDEKFPEDFQDKLLSEIRNEYLFKLQVSRAFVFGRTGAGKTTTINHLLDNEIFPTTGVLSCTRSLASGEHKGGLIFYDSPGIGDEPLPENVTRASLSINQLNEDKTNIIQLIDITSGNTEGPSTSYKRLSYEEFKDEISSKYYSENKERIMVKQFPLTDFQQWASNKFDFMVFVMNSVNGLGTNEQKFIHDLYNAKGHQIKLFKVMNVLGGKYEANIDKLEAGIKKRFDQAIDRLSKKNLPDADKWLVIDAANGSGIDKLIQAFADILPAHILKHLEHVVRAKYSHLIHEKIKNIFFDYIARVACLVAVFPVDYTAKEKNLMIFSIKSMVIMAEFLFTQTSKNIPTNILDEMISELQKSKYRTRYEKETKYEPILTGIRFIDWIKDKIGWLDYEIIETNTPSYSYAGIGGIDAIELTIAIGSALYEIYNKTNIDEISQHQLKEIILILRGFLWSRGQICII